MNGCNLECALIKSKVVMIMQLTMGYSALNYKSLLKCYYVAPELHLLYYEKKVYCKHSIKSTLQLLNKNTKKVMTIHERM